MDLEIKNAINKYYSLKSDYEKFISNNKTKIISLPGLSWKERQKEFRKLRPPCINCKRPVGSKFYTHVDEETIDRHLIALCGSKDSPCELNIDINLSNVFNFNEESLNNESELIGFKNSIIYDKNNLIFGYITSEKAVSNYEEVKEKLASISSRKDFYSQTLIEIVDNPEDLKTLQQHYIKLNTIIEDFKLSVENYEKTKEMPYMQEIINIYVNELIPFGSNTNLLKKIMNEKYKYNAIEINEIDQDDIYYLVQKPFTIENFEYVLDANIISFITGYVEDKSKTNLITNPKKIQNTNLNSIFGTDTSSSSSSGTESNSKTSTSISSQN